MAFEDASRPERCQLDEAYEQAKHERYEARDGSPQALVAGVVILIVMTVGTVVNIGNWFVVVPAIGMGFGVTILLFFKHDRRAYLEANCKVKRLRDERGH